MMAPRLSRGAQAPAPAEEKTVAAPAARTEVAVRAAASGPVAVPDEVRAVLQRLRAEVEQRCDYVGPHFADEARAMHHGEQPRRSIYGETTAEEAESLADEGIEVARIPWVPRADG